MPASPCSRGGRYASGPTHRPRAVSDYTVTQLEYTPLFKAIDAVLSGMDRLGLPATQLDADAILNEARRRTGLTDWGEEDFVEPMRRLLASARSRT